MNRIANLFFFLEAITISTYGFSFNFGDTICKLNNKLSIFYDDQTIVTLYANSDSLIIESCAYCTPLFPQIIKIKKI